MTLQPMLIKVRGSHLSSLMLLANIDREEDFSVSPVLRRRWLRNPVSLFILHNLSLAKRQKLAQKLRSSSKEETRMKASDIVDVTPDEVASIMQRYKVRTLIHGHTHRPATHSLQIDGQAAIRIVLGDWDRQGWALQVDDSGFHQAPFDLN